MGFFKNTGTVFTVDALQNYIYKDKINQPLYNEDGTRAALTYRDIFTSHGEHGLLLFYISWSFAKSRKSNKFVDIIFAFKYGEPTYSYRFSVLKSKLIPLFDAMNSGKSILAACRLKMVSCGWYGVNSKENISFCFFTGDSASDVMHIDYPNCISGGHVSEISLWSITVPGKVSNAAIGSKLDSHDEAFARDQRKLAQRYAHRR